jgi:hypothetical protein
LVKILVNDDNEIWATGRVEGMGIRTWDSYTNREK